MVSKDSSDLETGRNCPVSWFVGAEWTELEMTGKVRA